MSYRSSGDIYVPVMQRNLFESRIEVVEIYMYQLCKETSSNLASKWWRYICTSYAKKPRRISYRSGGDIYVPVMQRNLVESRIEVVEIYMYQLCNETSSNLVSKWWRYICTSYAKKPRRISYRSGGDIYVPVMQRNLFEYRIEVVEIYMYQLCKETSSNIVSKWWRYICTSYAKKPLRISYRSGGDIYVPVMQRNLVESRIEVVEIYMYQLCKETSSNLVSKWWRYICTSYAKKPRRISYRSGGDIYVPVMQINLFESRIEVVEIYMYQLCKETSCCCCSP